MKNFRALVILGWIWLSSANAIELGINQTFGDDGYTGNRAPVTFFSTKIDETNPKWLEASIEVDSYADDFARKRFFSFEPKLRVFAESEAGIMISYRIVPRTDDYFSHSVGVEVRYSVFHDVRSELSPAPLIEEVELAGEVRRGSHQDFLDSGRAARANEFQTSETQVILSARFLHSQWGSPKPKINLQLAKSFYAQDITGTERPGQMAPILGLTPFLQTYPSFVAHTSFSWVLGKPGGFSFEPRAYYTFFSPAGPDAAGYGVGAAIKAGASGFSVSVGGELVKQPPRNLRSFLTLGASVTF